LFIFADQWRQQAFGYAGDPNVKTPNLDAFLEESVHFTKAVSGCPICVPYRGSLMTGVYPHRHKLMVNDQCLTDRYDGPFLGECLSDAGYQTAYIGKWHVDGQGRNSFVPQERRLGFEKWEGFECNHNYNHSHYYTGDDPRPHTWKGYDADAQTDHACRFLLDYEEEDPFALFLSWGPPHNPYESAPEPYRSQYRAEDILLRPNVPEEHQQQAREELAGYYAHCTALDAAFGRLIRILSETGLDKNTIVVFTSDHGDMHGSQGNFRKQQPWAESIRIPFLLRHPDLSGGTCNSTPIDAPDLMPTLLSLCGAVIPESVQGKDFSRSILYDEASEIEYAFLSLYTPFHEWRYDNGGRAFRGLYTGRYTYIRSLDGPWLFYDNENDPFQQNNRVGDPNVESLVRDFDERLSRRLHELGDDFASGPVILERENYALAPSGDIALEPSELPEPYPC